MPCTRESDRRYFLHADCPKNILRKLLPSFLLHLLTIFRFLLERSSITSLRLIPFYPAQKLIQFFLLPINSSILFFDCEVNIKSNAFFGKKNASQSDFPFLKLVFVRDIIQSRKTAQRMLLACQSRSASFPHDFHRQNGTLEEEACQWPCRSFLQSRHGKMHR